ncbi:Histone-lysine N-methyltransferase SETMAR [Araneus ventricosus]|uniref:Histone-lysine N-methyltransferase SETMAR n=1 Tax=Araneus ventricosus TaxID=182803 RepID=A0A4Y2GCF5_ARAVE|nr:Histone-lysine N-methyltransferase SETMAR [Araneus ventricosus]
MLILGFKGGIIRLMELASINHYNGEFVCFKQIVTPPSSTKFFGWATAGPKEFCRPLGQTVNKELYLEILKRLRDAIRRKRPEKWATKDWILLHDNAPPHCALIVKKYLAIHSVTTLEHPPYSPDLAPADFYVFPRLKIKLKGHRFVDSDEVTENATKQLKDLSKNGFQECFEQLYERWKKCVDAGGKYFEGQ